MVSIPFVKLRPFYNCIIHVTIVTQGKGGGLGWIEMGALILYLWCDDEPDEDVFIANVPQRTIKIEMGDYEFIKLTNISSGLAEFKTQNEDSAPLIQIALNINFLSCF